MYAGMACGETGYAGWLRYAPIDPAARKMYAHLPAAIFVAGDSPVLQAAKNELLRGVTSMLGKTLHVESRIAAGDAVIFATHDLVHGIAPTLITPSLPANYVLKAMALDGHFVLLVAASDDRSVLYGVFALLRHIALAHDVENLDEYGGPYAPVLQARTCAKDHADIDYVEITPQPAAHP